MSSTSLQKGKHPIIDLNEDATEDIFENYENESMQQKMMMDELKSEQVFEMTFDSHEEAGEFYNTYGRYAGFSIRKDDLKYDKNHMAISRRWVCSREGYRSTKNADHDERVREPRGLTRVGCLATLRVKYDRKTGKWVVKDFVNDHNHPLVKPCGVPFLRSHRGVKSPDRAQATSLRNVGIRTSQIRDFMLQQSGGYQNIGFTTKDLYNDVASQRREEMRDGDAESALAYLSAKEELDPLFYFKYNLTEDNSLHCLFWADSTSRMDYKCFGDVLTFDTTYRTNVYKKPFVIFAGVNHHNATSIFGCALLSDETVETYVWVLSTFLHAMDNKMPISVITDGDKAMAAAIEIIFPQATHRLCRWHLTRNAFTNINSENFVQAFKRCMCTRCTPEEFEDLWKSMVESFGLETNNWIAEVYVKRFKWAEAYLRGIFFAGQTSTQRSESLNAYLNRFLKVRQRLFEFVRQYDRGLARIREAEANDDFESEHSEPVLTTALKCLEEKAAKTYTRKMFFKVRDQLKDETLFFVVDKIESITHRSYYLSRFTQPESRWIVQYYPGIYTFKCNCMKFESIGIPCSHTIAIMKYEHLKEFPPTIVMKRWTITAKSDYQTNDVSDTLSFPSVSRRYAGLMSMCSRMCYYASQSMSKSKEVRNMVHQETFALQAHHDSAAARGYDSAATGYDGSKEKFGVGDPKFVKTKGNSGRVRKNISITPRRCSKCRGIGHTIRKCPLLTPHLDDPYENMPFSHVDESHNVHYFPHASQEPVLEMPLSQPGGSQQPLPAAYEDEDQWTPF